MLLRKQIFAMCLVVLAAVVVWSLGPVESNAAVARGSVDLQSVGALELGPKNVLFLADSEAAAVYAVEVDVPEASGESYEMIQDLDAKIGAMLGVASRDVYVKDMAVHQPSGTAFLSVMRGSGDTARPIVLSIARDGAIAEVELDDVAHSRLALGDAPSKGAKLYRRDSRALAVTDLEFIDGELFIAGLSNEEFASKLRRASYPFDGAAGGTGLEIYHGAHGAWETFAPIFSFIPYEIGGDDYLLAGYLCTPLVTFSLDDVRSNERLRGKTLAELGWGNTPIDIIEYSYGGEEFVLIANNRRGTMKIKASDIETAQKGAGITTESEPRTGLDYHTVPLGNVAQVADFDEDNILVLGRSMENGALALMVRAKKWL